MSNTIPPGLSTKLETYLKNGSYGTCPDCGEDADSVDVDGDLAIAHCSACGFTIDTPVLDQFSTGGVPGWAERFLADRTSV